jgi:uncharacterized repeat protein (TIGR01451 family)
MAGTLAILLLVFASSAIPSNAGAASVPSSAGLVPIRVDGDLTDLVQAIDANAGPALGGFRAEAPAIHVGLTGAAGCGSYVNGFDLDGLYAWFDYRNADGSIRRDAAGKPDVTLYVGWHVTGQVGDVDGDGDPDRATIARSDCYKVVPGFRPSQQVDEYYEVTLDLSCGGDFHDPSRTVTFGVVSSPAMPDGRLVVNPRTAGQTEVAGAFAFRNGASSGNPADGHGLEARIDHLQDHIPPGTDLGHVTLAFAAGAAGDGLIDDAERPGFVFAAPVSIGVTRTPETHASCPGAAVDWAIVIRNDGLGTIRDLSVTDVLDPGLVYAGDDLGSAGDAHTRTWSPAGGALAPGQTVTIRMNAVLSAPCAGPLLDHVRAQALSACDTSVTESTVAGAAVRAPVLPTAFELYANSPNPFPLATTFRFALPERSRVTLAVFSVAGQRVAEVVDGRYEPGIRSIEWRAVGRNGRRLADGVYFYRYRAVGMASGRTFEKSSQIVIRR